MADQPGQDPRDQSLGDLLRQLSQETATLVRKELELAKAELTQKGKKAGLGAGLFGAAGVVGFLAAFSFTLFLIFLLGDIFDSNVWLGALIVAIVYGIAAAVLGMQGKEKVQEATPPAPQTVETVKEDVEWAKNPRQSAGR